MVPSGQHHCIAITHEEGGVQSLGYMGGVVEALHAEEERRRVRAEEVHRLRVEMASLEEKAGSLQRDVARLSRLEEDYASVMRRHEQEAQNAVEKSEELQRSRTAHQEELQKLTEELQKLEHLRKELDERRVVLQMDTARLSEEIRATRRTYRPPRGLSRGGLYIEYVCTE